jgi:hypothetical protein
MRWAVFKFTVFLGIINLRRATSTGGGVFSGGESGIRTHDRFAFDEDVNFHPIF